MSKNLVSVVMTVFNEEKYLEKAIDSILAQTYPFWELIIVNDGSTDRSDEIIRAYNNERIRYFSYEKNKGNPYALNLGMENALGEYIVPFAGDDIAYPNMLEVQVKYLNDNPNCIHVHGTMDYIDDAGVVIKNTFLSNGDASALRRKLLEECNVHTILDLPSGVFTGAGVKTVVVFFTKGEPTKKIWYYQLNPGRNLGKTNALNAKDLAEFIELYKTKADSEDSWTLDVANLGDDYDLSVKNPNCVEVVDDRTTQDILNAIAELNENSASLIAEIRELL